ncbi:hypothetical protein VE03_05048 [Pseudogymnoascus sp. 23342-1-I1]|nr:hypothetical protein VE03_05048 [Pseudogymnoascus sp. 23342-1-I1]
MSALPTPPFSPTKEASNVGNGTVEARQPTPPNAPDPHTYSLTPLELLPRRLRYRRQQARRRPQRPIVLNEPEIAREAPRLQNAMWGVDGVERSERAEAAAILESVVSRWVVSRTNRERVPRWLSDDERLSGRVYDRAWGIETVRLIPWRYATPDYSGPSMVYDVLFGRVRRLQIQDYGRFRDAEDNLGVWGKEMEITNVRGVESEDEEEEEPENVDMEEDSEEDYTEDDESEGEATDGDEAYGDVMDEAE